MSARKSKRQTVKLLVTEGMGYCCPFAFFSLYRQTALIAARLGVSDRAIRYAKAAFKAGEYRCQGCSDCLRAKRPSPAPDASSDTRNTARKPLSIS